MNFEEKILKMEEKNDVTHRRKKKKVRLTLGFSSEIMQAGDIGMTSL